MIKSLLSKIFASIVKKQIDSWAKKPIETQQKVFEKLITDAQNTAFGKAHQFAEIKTYEDFVARVPVRDYEALRPYIDRVVEGEKNVLWRGKPLYFAKTSGTTSGAKYIPITKDSMPHHIQNARNAILCYIHETKKADFVNGKMIFLQGSPILSEKNGIKVGRLSGIVAHYVPAYLQRNRMPSYKTNCIEDWETKVEAIVTETFSQDMTLISGIPSWVLMYFERLYSRAGIKVGKLFPNFNLFIYGGVNYEPYRQKFEHLIGRKVDSIELYPASEGFFAYQDSQTEKGMLLQLNSGIFYEFIEADSFFTEQPKRIPLKEVQLGVNYALIISTNAGLWGYNIGDTVQFTSLAPYRIVVTGRIKHFISAFGEHVIAKEVEEAMQVALEATGARITEFTVAPQVNPAQGELPYHEWFVEFETMPKHMKTFARLIDEALQKQNMYYYDLIQGKVLQPLKITKVPTGGFAAYMKAQGKLGGQNKIQRLANDRSVVKQLKL
ncbi:GH3 auxin-responsive promoter family protein [Capnocytophaga sp. Marseille-Q4570]|uniref:GH3 auxin-responsive promoter family protein n=1 Tax=Capnocytophaga bilenii TaxID=2819369 RepID=A0ABS3Q081_9FLAO|nr:GH3 auxin-responsive promoter family protein [Capnocytophaga bilenii]MBO1884999.1 GH3 auxin-responsive promoter family protein [Capnocytophaga bilenii]